MMPLIAATPVPPYWAVVFTSQLTEEDAGYAETARRMLELARVQPGFLGVESARDAAGAGITVSYWESAEAIAAWRQHADHTVARELGRARWYRRFRVRICRVEREASFERGAP